MERARAVIMTAPRAAIYARFSSDLQDDRSVADQLALCRDYAARQGWTIAATYADHGISGASIHGRDEFQRMVADAEARRFEIIVAEDVDRFARNAADSMRLKETADFLGVRLFTVADGEANELLFGFKGLMSAAWLKSHALKVRRGQEGRVRAGLAPGGRAYGYAPVPGKPGERMIVEAEAAIVRRILTEYAAGLTPRQIAHGLNRDHVPAPRGPRWNASTIHGNTVRGYGILANPLYRGVIRWNRVRMVKDPATGRRLSRCNPAEAQRDTPMPALAIVPDDLAAAVDARRNRPRARAEQYRRPRYLLSGLLRCASCGGGLVIAGHDKSGRKRVRCSTAKESGTCAAAPTFYLDTIERVVLARLRTEFADPRVITTFVKEYHAERARLAGAGQARRDAIERRLPQIARDQARAVDAIIAGVGDVTAIGDRSKQLAAEAEALRAELATLAAAPRVVALHPAVLKRFEEQVTALQASLAAAIEAGDADAQALRELVECVTVRRDPSRAEGLAVLITGRLERLTGAPPHNATPDAWPVCLTSVAGERYRRQAHPFQLAG